MLVNVKVLKEMAESENDITNIIKRVDEMSVGEERKINQVS